MSYLFYAANVMETSLSNFETILKELTVLNINISGCFHGQGEDGKQNIIDQITNNWITKNINQGSLVYILENK